MLDDCWVFVDSLKSAADKKTLFYMEASSIKTSMYYFFNYCIFKFSVIPI